MLQLLLTGMHESPQGLESERLVF
ncbi:hypothetical protein PPSIR1_33244 [Plesiocystis pacifica SIR-1]|uniref:Uncharacterized protein n=1 Tax=Plesiocystis pacifica SIR-1 TaxID=391625 RepID=A6G6K5_9BACT|nr:hypothetical protein PPSIR1_33244 [Plesiocystis pacifica SIR-1]